MIEVQIYMNREYKNVQVTDAQASEFLHQYAGVGSITEIKESRGKFAAICPEFRISVNPKLVAYWCFDSGFNGRNDRDSKITTAVVDVARQLVKKGRRISINISSSKNTMTLTEGHVKIEAHTAWGSHISSNLYVKNQDGKWIMQHVAPYQPNRKSMTNAEAIEHEFARGFKNPAPLSKEQILEKGTPTPHEFNTSGRLTRCDHAWIKIKDHMLERVRVDGIVAINPDRTVRSAEKPDGEDAWFMIECRLKAHVFMVLSNGEVYHVMTKIGTKYKVVESTQICRSVDAGDMTDLDKTMIQEAIEFYTTDAIGA